MLYKAIGFDWGGVIKGRLGSNFNKEVCEVIGVDIENFRQAYFTHNKDVNRGDIDWPELWRRVLGDLDKVEFVDQVLAINQERSTNLPEQINFKIIDLVDNLKKKGYRVGLLSNNTLKAGKDLRGLGIDKHFDVFHISAETRLVKPELEAFELFVSELGVQTNELIFIDDAEKSLSTSKECGFTPVLYTGYDNLLDQLKSLGIEV